jgi:hypothetical protein
LSGPFLYLRIGLLLCQIAAAAAHFVEQRFNAVKFDQGLDRKSTRLNSSHNSESRMPSSA